MTMCLHVAFRIVPRPISYFSAEQIVLDYVSVYMAEKPGQSTPDVLAAGFCTAALCCYFVYYHRILLTLVRFSINNSYVFKVKIWLYSNAIFQIH